jgi:uncharacterized protein YbjT (DUF2867 family)
VFRFDFATLSSYQWLGVLSDSTSKKEIDMTILITGATGTIGSLLVQQLADQHVAVNALTRDPSKAKFPSGVTAVSGDMLDVESMRKALQGVSTLFLLNSVSTQELTEAVLTLNLARQAGIERVVYLSVFNGEAFSNVPHFTSKHAVERMISQMGISATILRPNCFMQNDAMFFKDALMGPGLYPFPIGDKGVSMVDVRDIAEIAAQAVLKRERASQALPNEIINLVGPDALTGSGIAKIWAAVLNKQVNYTGSDTAPFEARLAQHAPSWMAMDMRLMLDRFCSDGMAATAADVGKMAERLGRRPRCYADFAAETRAQWVA